MYSKIYLRLEPLGLELVAAAAREARHSVRLIDLQCESHRNFFHLIRRWRPDVIAFSGNYLANVPEIIDLARATRALLSTAFISVGGHSVSFIPEEILRHTAGALDCVLIGEGETAITSLLDALAKDRANLREVPGCVTLDHRGPPPTFVKSLDDLVPARDLGAGPWWRAGGPDADAGTHRRHRTSRRGARVGTGTVARRASRLGPVGPCRPRPSVRHRGAGRAA